MSAPINAVLTGQFVSAGTVLTIPMVSQYQDFEMLDMTDFGSATSTSVMKARGSSYMAAGSAYYDVGSGANSILTSKYTSTGGFTFIADSGNQTPGAQLSGSALSSAAPGVVSSANTSTLGNGNIVRMYNTTGILQISGMDFTVSAVTANSVFSLAYLDTTQTNLTAGSTSNYRIIPFNPRYYPSRRFITDIGASSGSSIITLSVTHGYTVGQAVRIYVPSNFGSGTSPFISGSVPSTARTATITAIGAADTSGFTNTITVNVNSAAYTWGWPTSASFATGSQVAFVEPVGEAATVPYQNLLDDATYNQSFSGIQIGTTVQTSGKTYQWFARSGIALS
jgi:hypothetical protein